MAIVLTVDQVDSRRDDDRVPEVLAQLAHLPTVRPFDRTAGDEVQAVFDSPEAAVDAVLTLVRDGRWSIGIGVGDVEEPLPATTRAGRGPAFTLARDAVEAAKKRPQRIAVRAQDAASAQDAEAVLTLIAALLERRSDAAWDAVDLAGTGLTTTQVADKLGVTRQAVGQRLAAAQWKQELAARPTAARLLAVVR